MHRMSSKSSHVRRLVLYEVWTGGGASSLYHSAPYSTALDRPFFDPGPARHAPADIVAMGGEPSHDLPRGLPTAKVRGDAVGSGRARQHQRGRRGRLGPGASRAWDTFRPHD
eukprot:4908056-Prymnesium_polylepis.2